MLNNKILKYKTNFIMDSKRGFAKKISKEINKPERCTNN